MVPLIVFPDEIKEVVRGNDLSDANAINARAEQIVGRDLHPWEKDYGSIDKLETTKEWWIP